MFRISKNIILPLILFVFFTVVDFYASDSSAVQNVNLRKIVKKINSAKNLEEKLEAYEKIILLTYENNPEVADRYLEEMFANLNPQKNKDKYCFYFQYKGAVEVLRGNTVEGVKYLVKALEVAEQMNDYDLQKNILTNLAATNMKIGNYDKGIEYFEKVIKLDKQNEKSLDADLLNLGLAYAEAGRVEKAKEILKKVYISTDNDFYAAVATNSLSFIHNKLGEYGKAIQYAKRALTYADTSSNLMFRLEALTNYGNALNGAKKFKEAKKVMNRIINLASKNNLAWQRVNALGNIATIYENEKNYKEALAFFKRFYSEKDSLANADVAKRISELQLKFESEKKDKELAIKNAELAKKNLIIRFSATIIVLLLIFALTFFVLYKKKRDAYLDLVRKHVATIKKVEPKKGNAHLISGGEKTAQFNDLKIEELHSRIEKMIKEDKLYKQKDLTLGKFASILGVSSKYLSQVIHSKYGKTFPDFINSFRVEEAAKMLLNPEYENYSLEAIGEMAGFNSRSVFNASFKKFTGVTPSFYMKSAKQVLKEEVT